MQCPHRRGRKGDGQMAQKLTGNKEPELYVGWPTCSRCHMALVRKSQESKFIHPYAVYVSCINSERVYLYRNGILTRTFQWDDTERKEQRIADLTRRLNGTKGT